MVALKVMDKVTKLKKTKTRVTKKVRDYNNSKRREKVDMNKQKIIQLYVDLLVQANGEDIPLQALAKKSKISLRTLFRFFGDKESLNQEIENYMTHYFESAQQNMQAMSFAAYAEFAYQVFDQYEKMFLAYLLTNFGQRSRQIFRQKLYEMLVKKIQHELSLGTASVEQQKKMRLIVVLINSQIWKDMRDSFGVSGTEMSATIRWAVETLIADLKKT